MGQYGKCDGMALVDDSGCAGTGPTLVYRKLLVLFPKTTFLDSYHEIFTSAESQQCRDSFLATRMKWFMVREGNRIRGGAGARTVRCRQS